MARRMLSDELWSKLREILQQHRIYDKPSLREMERVHEKVLTFSNKLTMQGSGYIIESFLTNLSNVMKIPVILILLLSFSLLVGCAHQGEPKTQFMKNTPEHINIGKLPYSNETGILYDI